MSKIIRCAVRCEYWSQSRQFEVEVEEDATDEQVEEAMKEAAMEEARIEWWQIEGEEE